MIKNAKTLVRQDFHRRGGGLKALSAAALAGTLVFGANVAGAEESANPIILGTSEANNLLLTKPVDTPTLDFLKQNNILIPQKKYDEATKTLVDGGAPVPSQESAYKIIEGTVDDYTFEYKTADEAGNLTSTYYKLVQKDEYSADLIVRKPTLDRLEEAGTLIEQKGEWNADTKTWETADPITSPGSVYKLTAGTADRYVFKLDNKDKDGNITKTDYYNITLRHSELVSESSQFGTSKNIQWTKLDTAPETGATDTITIKYSNTVTDYYKYTINEAGYSEVQKDITKDLGTITNPEGTSDNHAIIEGGAALNNPKGTTIAINNELYLNNKVTAIMESTTSGRKYIDILGGAIYNAGNITDITADFVGNSITDRNSGYYLNVYTYGGAIANKGTIGNITGDFINNSVSNFYYNYGYGGAIYNTGTIGNITGDFINNSGSDYGGAIYNTGTIGNITGDFINNSASNSGGAIYNNNGTIGNITGDFINNSNNVIYNDNSSTICNITGDFINNSGRAIYNNSSTIGNITGDFINNSGRAIDNISGTMGNITGDFINNSGIAIYNNNSSTIGNITGDFINNSGGAIDNNNGTIGNITGDFINNSGGAIDNISGTIGNITGDFINNSGNAIYNNNSSTIGNITGNFINNQKRAIENFNLISNIYGNFINNGEGGLLNGDAKNKNANINEIKGTFINNSTEYRGGGLNNSGTISLVEGDFQNNYARIFGGGIYNASKIDKIKGNFIGNYINNYPYGSGGAIQNGARSITGNIGTIEGNFIGNHIDVLKETLEDSAEGLRPASVYYAQGGAIFNETESNIDKIKGNFINNSTTSNGYADGGAIHNSLSSTIGEIEGSFIQNHVIVTDDSEYYSQGGAIQNLASGKIGKITGDFVGNFTKGAIASSGGAIFNSKSAEISYIKGNFENNFARSCADGNYSQGGAIYNSSDGILKYIEGNFTNNYVFNAISGNGGAIYNNNAIIEKVNGNFQNNYASGKSYVAGGAIYNYYGQVNELNGSFINNYAKSENGTAKGGAIFSLGTTSLVADSGKTNIIRGNYVEDRNGKRNEAIYVSTGQELVTNTNEIKSVSGSGFGFYNKYSNYNPEKDNLPAAVDSQFNIIAKDNGTIIIDDIINGDSTPGVVDYDVTTYYANWNSTQRVYVDMDDNFLVKSVATVTKEDIVIGQDENTSSDIIGTKTTSNITYTNEAGETLAKEVLVEIPDLNQSTSTYYDADGNEISELPFEKSTKISNKMEYNINFDGDSSGRVYLNNNIQGGANITLANTNLHLGKEDVLDGNYLALNSGSISLLNNQVGISSPASLVVNGNTNFIGDVDLKNKVMDRFVTDNYGEHSGNLNVAGLNLISDANPDEKLTAVYFAQPDLKYNVTNGISGGSGDLPDINQTTVYTPIYKYNVTYDNQNEYDGKGDGGYFLFAKGDQIITPGGGTTSTGNPSDAFNPAVLTAPVAGVAASQSTINETFKYVFEHADAFTQLPQMERLSFLEANKYALSTDFNDNLLSPRYHKGSLDYDINNKALWVRPYTSIEDVNIKRGPAVDSINYGTLIGYDGDFTEMRHGWHRIGTTYLGYNGAQLDYAGNSTSLNGGLIGGTETYYKGNFWTAVTASAGVSVGETHTMYGKEDFTNLLAGVASKSGYNFEFKEGKYIIQPIMFISYTFVNTFDFKNAAGVKIKSDPSHSIQIHPNIRFIANCKNGWQPYAQVGAVWNVYNKSHVTADGIKLPSMTSMPYVEYGAGIQRNWKDSFTAFAQTMVRNGGRTGIAFTAGFRWALGEKEQNTETEKVQNVVKERKLVSTHHNANLFAPISVKSIVTGAAAAPTTTRTIVKQLKR